MRTGVGDEADLARGRAIGDELLAEEHDAQRRRIWPLELVRPYGGEPVLPEQLAHGRARADAAEKVVVLRA
jgi:hypothetical protein